MSFISQVITSSNVRWLALFSAILIAWWAMFDMAASHSDMASHAHHMTAGNVGTMNLFIMWALMALAMMAPSIVPMLQTYIDLDQTQADTHGGFYGLVLGYLLAWVIFAIGATYLQLSLAHWNLIDPQGQSVSLWLNAGLLLLAGVYQFSSIKAACLTQCRMPLSFLMNHWQDGFSGAVKMGLRLGFVCVVCCWALMVMGFIGGIMSLAWMGAATVLMTVEKLPQLGHYVTRPIGVLFVLASLWVAALAMG